MKTSSPTNPTARALVLTLRELANMAVCVPGDGAMLREAETALSLATQIENAMASDPPGVTGAYDFAPVSGDEHDGHLFSVRAGIPFERAINDASCRMGAALDTLRSAACGLERSEESAAVWCAVYTLEAVEAVLQAIERGIADAAYARHHAGGDA